MFGHNKNNNKAFYSLVVGYILKKKLGYARYETQKNQQEGRKGEEDKSKRNESKHKCSNKR
jgi:hypothetical protein